MNMGVDVMKMVITDIKDNTAVGLGVDGTFVRLRQHGYAVGQTVEIKRSPRVIRLAAACAAAVMILGGSGVAAVRLPYSYVTLDINPSVKYTLNVFNRVLTVSAVNEDAKSIVDAIEEENVAYATLDDAIEMTIEQCQTEGYIEQDDEDYVVLAVTSRSDGKTTSLSRQLGSSDYGGGHISTKVVSTTISRMKEAEQMGTTPGKLTIIGEMQESTGDTQAPDQWINVPVRDIIRATERGEYRENSQGVPARNPNREDGDSKTEIDADGTSDNENASGGRDRANSRQTNGHNLTESSAGAQADSSEIKSDSESGSGQISDDPAQEESPKEEKDDNRSGQFGNKQDDSPAANPAQVEKALSVLSDADRELLSSYIEAYETAVAAAKTAAESEQAAEDLSSYQDAITQAFSALCKAAEVSGIELGLAVPESTQPERQDGRDGRERDSAQSFPS